MADFLLECGKALGDVRALEQAAGVTLSYYRLVEGTGQDSPCLETLRLVRALEGAGLLGLAAEVTAALVRHADRTVARGKAMYSEEVSYTQEQFSMKVLALCQAWALTGRASYLERVPGPVRCGGAFAGRQRDFRKSGAAALCTGVCGASAGLPPVRSGCAVLGSLLVWGKPDVWGHDAAVAVELHGADARAVRGVPGRRGAVGVWASCGGRFAVPV